MWCSAGTEVLYILYRVQYRNIPADPKYGVPSTTKHTYSRPSICDGIQKLTKAPTTSFRGNQQRPPEIIQLSWPQKVRIHVLTVLTVLASTNTILPRVLRTRAVQYMNIESTIRIPSQWDRCKGHRRPGMYSVCTLCTLYLTEVGTPPVTHPIFEIIWCRSARDQLLWLPAR